MNVLETDWWTMVVPPDWWAEHEDDSILVGDRDGVGCLEFSTLHKDQGTFDVAAAQAIAESEAEQRLDWQRVTVGEFKGVESAWIDAGDAVAIREWYLVNDALLLFITYSCDEENGGMDDAAVNELLDTLMAVDAQGTS
ncbi:MAG: hypothetical protein HOC23_01635 [Halieaceae bacterium]|jgi:hypothetical protein|nr:hypothetical protein [Halieaceae bacterium]